MDSWPDSRTFPAKTLHHWLVMACAHVLELEKVFQVNETRVCASAVSSATCVLFSRLSIEEWFRASTALVVHLRPELLKSAGMDKPPMQSWLLASNRAS